MKKRPALWALLNHESSVLVIRYWYIPQAAFGKDPGAFKKWILKTHQCCQSHLSSVPIQTPKNCTFKGHCSGCLLQGSLLPRERVCPEHSPHSRISALKWPVSLKAPALARLQQGELTQDAGRGCHTPGRGVCGLGGWALNPSWTGVQLSSTNRDPALTAGLTPLVASYYPYRQRGMSLSWFTYKLPGDADWPMWREVGR